MKMKNEERRKNAQSAGAVPLPPTAVCHHELANARDESGDHSEEGNQDVKNESNEDYFMTRSSKPRDERASNASLGIEDEVEKRGHLCDNSSHFVNLTILKYYVNPDDAGITLQPKKCNQQVQQSASNLESAGRSTCR